MPHRSATRTFVVASLIATGALLAGCAQTVNGHEAAASASSSAGGANPTGSNPTGSNPGSNPTGASNPSGGTDFPTSATPTTSTQTASGTAPASHLACPNVVDATARLSYQCISNAMKLTNKNPMWPTDFEQTVETEAQATWTMDEGSAVDIGTGTVDVEAKALTQQMVSQFYGDPNDPPTSKTLQAGAVALGNANGYGVQTLITINPKFRSAYHLKVRQEELSLVVVSTGNNGQLSAWYASVPDLEKQLWPKVLPLAKKIKVG